MKKIDEMFDNYELNEDINIEPSDIDDLELKRIKELTKKKANINTTKVRKKLIIPLVAASIMILSVAVVSANVNLEELFGKIFNTGYEYVQDMGKIVGVNNTNDGVTLSVDGIIGDENSMYILFSMIRDDKTPFDAEWAIFDSLDFNLYDSGGWSYEMLEDENPNDNKISFLLEVSMENGIHNKDVTLRASGLKLYTNNTSALDFNIYDYLINNPELIGEEKKSTYKDMPIGNLTEEEKQNLENEYRAKLLPIKNLNIPISDNDNSIMIDNIYLDNGKLSVSFYIDNNELNDIGSPFLLDKNTGEKIFYTGISNHDKSYKYYTYDFSIGTMDELKNYTLGCDTINTTDYIQSNWEVQFKADYNKQIKKINVNQSTIINDKKFTIKNFKLSPISLVVTLKESLLDKESDPVTNLDNSLSINLKDGTVVECNRNTTSTGGTNATIITQFAKPIDINSIISITVGNETIEIN